MKNEEVSKNEIIGMVLAFLIIVFGINYATQYMGAYNAGLITGAGLIIGFYYPLKKIIKNE